MHGQQCRHNVRPNPPKLTSAAQAPRMQRVQFVEIVIQALCCASASGLDKRTNSAWPSASCAAFLTAVSTTNARAVTADSLLIAAYVRLSGLLRFAGVREDACIACGEALSWRSPSQVCRAARERTPCGKSVNIRRARCCDVVAHPFDRSASCCSCRAA
jgi:lysylphosphatidylglycerol synthetase-like protein (DUF2156 family)